jgi:HK97 family phage prohead protease
MERVKQTKIYKSQISDITDKGSVIVAVNAFGNVDAQKDRSLKGSFDKTISENIDNIYWYKNHDDNEEPGVIKRLFTDDRYLMAELKFNLDKEFSRNLYSDYQFKQANGKTVRHSIGVTALQFKDNSGIRDVSEWKLWEVSSLTKWPANFETPTLSIKSLQNVNDILQELTEYVDWIKEKGLHTDEFIIGFDNILTGLRQQIKAPDKGEPAQLAAKTEINPIIEIDYNYLLTKI